MRPSGPARRPRWTLTALRALARGESAEYALGDLDEEFEERLRDPETVKDARGWYRRQLLRSLVPLLRDGRHDRRRALSGVRRSAPVSLKRRPSMFPSLVQDVRYAFRSFSRRPGLALTALVTASSPARAL